MESILVLLMHSGCRDVFGYLLEYLSQFQLTRLRQTCRWMNEVISVWLAGRQLWLPNNNGEDWFVVAEKMILTYNYLYRDQYSVNRNGGLSNQYRHKREIVLGYHDHKSDAIMNTLIYGAFASGDPDIIYLFVKKVANYNCCISTKIHGFSNPKINVGNLHWAFYGAIEAGNIFLMNWLLCLDVVSQTKHHAQDFIEYVERNDPKMKTELQLTKNWDCININSISYLSEFNSDEWTQQFINAFWTRKIMLFRDGPAKCVEIYMKTHNRVLLQSLDNCRLPLTISSQVIDTKMIFDIALKVGNEHFFDKYAHNCPHCQQINNAGQQTHWFFNILENIHHHDDPAFLDKLLCHVNFDQIKLDKYFECSGVAAGEEYALRLPLCAIRACGLFSRLPGQRLGGYHMRCTKYLIQVIEYVYSIVCLNTDCEIKMIGMKKFVDFLVKTIQQHCSCNKPDCPMIYRTAIFSNIVIRTVTKDDLQEPLLRLIPKHLLEE